MKLFSEHFGLPITCAGSIATVTMSYINEHITAIVGVLTAIYVIICIVYKGIKTKRLLKNKEIDEDEE